MKTLIAALMGLCSGLLIGYAGALTFPKGGVTYHVGVALWGVIFVTWGASTVGLRWNTRSNSEVLQRGFWLGAAEWLVLMVGLPYYSGNVLSVGHPQRAIEAARLGRFYFRFSMAMAIVCMLMAFAIRHFTKKKAVPAAAPVDVC